jgi:hypothetical protein
MRLIERTAVVHVRVEPYYACTTTHHVCVRSFRERTWSLCGRRRLHPSGRQRSHPSGRQRSLLPISFTHSVHGARGFGLRRHLHARPDRNPARLNEPQSRVALPLSLMRALVCSSPTLACARCITSERGQCSCAIGQGNALHQASTHPSGWGRQRNKQPEVSERFLLAKDGECKYKGILQQEH